MKSYNHIITSMLAAILLSPLMALGAEKQNVVNAQPYVDHSLPDCGLQKAIDQAAETGGTVQVPAGTFELRRGLILKSNVVLKGAGQGQTILMPKRQVERIDFTKPGPDENGWVDVDLIPASMKPGSAVVIWRLKPWDHVGRQRPAWVAAVDRDNRRLKLEFVYGYPGHRHGTETKLVPGKNLMSYGVALSLDRDVEKGDSEIVLKDASLLQPGDEIAVGQPTNDSRDRQRFVKAVNGNTVVLTEAVAHPLKAWEGKGWLASTRMPFALHPAIHGWDVKDAAIRELTVKGHGLADVHATQVRYTLSAIHLFNTENLVIEDVAVQDWPSDGFSLQVAEGAVVRRCRAENVFGNGFHPGTGFKNGRFEDCVGVANGTGFYWCWHNQHNVVKRCEFIRNRGGGMTGLGNPSDRDNLIEDNVFAGNGTYGIAINGGKESGNVIKNNTIENNSRKTPGKYPGIAIHAKVEDALKYTIEGNTIRDTQSEKTQWVGIEEKHGVYRDKPTRADANVFRGNQYAGHQTADVIRSGENSLFEEAASVKVVTAPAEPQ